MFPQYVPLQVPAPTGEGDLIGEVVRQVPAIILVIGFLFTLVRGYVRTPQEVAAINETKAAYKEYVDTLVPAVRALTDAIHTFVETSTANQHASMEKLDNINRQLEVIADRRILPRE